MESKQSRNEYLRRIHKVQDYIESNIDSSLSIEKLADIAGFSKFHFHRIFKGIVDEPLSRYVNRLKLERATNLLTYRLDMTITDIAYHFGFTDSAVFSRTFKNYYGVSPSQYRNDNSKNCKDVRGIPQYNECKKVRGNVEIVTADDINVAYIRHIGTYGELTIAFPKMIEKVFHYAAKQNYHVFDDTKVLTIYHDHHEFTEDYHLRTSLCITIPDASAVETNDIGIMVIPSGKYAVGHFEIFQDEYKGAWDFIYGEWLQNSGYKPRDSYPFEMYKNDPRRHPEKKHIVDIYVPIEPF
ncbi:AraC family transcriptional regulator [Bacillus cereus BAG1X2-3]|uniref:AraC family transcriptional regulator n=1 Tax=Bacillus cereus TaxID=1396 RepID=A0A9X7EB34_BACCE|nr:MULTISPECIES: GyrI-like domain-containing protein [Bacillus cereus group]EOO28174.1 AraC family transcriptional regulator [Bacillus cereus BAG1X1-1]EOO48581.1 AraC family transcriptional regulator [Bacillus cereus BAG1X2-1]EOO52740.1 AraC family transcriptional regulator [Bacillus cereus BAG1X2-2]EOO59305.1 AraC family transcriptional regulator [Bacillus cereus BAG1X2-3]EOP05406.1 AraC family transcriptional regulator [Bacillus cereus BAG2O-1]